MEVREWRRVLAVRLVVMERRLHYARHLAEDAPVGSLLETDTLDRVRVLELSAGTLRACFEGTSLAVTLAQERCAALRTRLRAFTLAR